jgi:hypothetical protein
MQMEVGACMARRQQKCVRHEQVALAGACTQSGVQAWQQEDIQ